MFDRVATSPLTRAGSAGSRVQSARYSTSSPSRIPYAAVVAAMLREMNSASLVAALGLTENCSIAAGQMTPMTSADSSIRTVATAGIRRSRRNTAAKNATAQTIAIAIRISLAGSITLMSV